MSPAPPDPRPIPASDIDQVHDLADIVFHERFGSNRPQDRWLLANCERRGVYEGDRLVAMLGALPLRLAVPGGEAACVGLTFAGVLPTHRRRGLLSALMARTWAEAAERGQSVAALWVSEGAIYGRYGCAPATRAHTVEVASVRPLALRVAPDPGPLRLLPIDRAAAVLGPWHERHVRERPGQLMRSEEWWREVTLAQRPDDQRLGVLRAVVLGDEADPAGYALYRTAAGEEWGDEPGWVEVTELEGRDAAAEATLWAYLCSIDLTAKVRCWGRPVDDPLPLIAADPDQVRVTSEWSALWLRLIDVRAAIERRSTAADADLTLELADATLPANAGRWRLRAEGGRAALDPAPDAEPDLALDVRELAACYLGGSSPLRLAAAGLIEERRPGAARLLDEALRTPRAPFATDFF